jgi:transposase-like protein
MLLPDLAQDLPSFLARFGTDEQCRAYLFQARWPHRFRCAACGHGRAWAHKPRLLDEGTACGKQHSLLAGTMVPRELPRDREQGRDLGDGAQAPDGFGSYQTAWSWLHKIRKARSGRSGRGHARGRRLGRLRLAVVADVSASSLEGFLAAAVAQSATIATDGWSNYGGLEAAGDAHEPLNLSASGGDAALRLPAIPLVFGLAKRWLLGTHHGAVSRKHLPAYLDEFVFRFNRRTAKRLSHRFARVIEHAVQIRPTPYRALVAPHPEPHG